MRPLNAPWRRFGALLRRRASERDLAAEMDSALVELEAELARRGVPPPEARRQARIALGGIEQVKEAVRAERGGARLESLARDARFAVRALAHARGYTLVVLLTLSVAVGGTTAIFTLLRSAFSEPSYPRASRLVHIWASWPGGFGNLSYPDFEALREQNHAFARLAAYESWGAVALTGHGRPQMLRTSFITQDYLPLLGARAVLGRTFVPAEDEAHSGRPVVILSEACWRRQFGGAPGVVGQALRLNGHAFAVVGVLSAGFRDVGMAEGDPPPDVWLPIATAPALLGQPPLTDPYSIFWAVGLLRPGVGLAQAKANLDAVAARRAHEDPANNAAHGLELQSLAVRAAGAMRQPALLLSAGAALILLLACVNLACATIVRSVRRRGELALRRALGASSSRLVQQLLVEAALLAAAGGIGGIVLADLLTRALGRWVQAHVAALVDVHPDGGTLLGAASLALLTLLLFGVVPTLGRQLDLTPTLRGSGGKGASAARQRSWRGLVIAEVALSTILLVGAGLMARSVVRLLDGSLGFDPQHLLTFRIDLAGERYPDGPARARFAQVLEERLRAVDGVRTATLLGPSMLGNATWVMSVLPRERQAPRPEDFIQGSRHSVNPGALAHLGIPLLRGREVDRHDTADSPAVAILSASLARQLWGTLDVVGRQLQSSRPGRPPITVIGVAADAQHRDRYSLGDIAAGIGPSGIGPQRDLYVPYAQRPNPSITVALRFAGDAAAVAEGARRALAQIDAALPLSDAALFTDRLRAQQRAPLVITELLAAYAAFAFFLAALGLHGVIAQSVQQRTREIGIRLALGARASDILRRFVLGGAALAAIGIGGGALGAVVLGRSMASLLFGITPGDPPTFAAVAAALLLMALVASFLPVRWVLGHRPVEVLRSE